VLQQPAEGGEIEAPVERRERRRRRAPEREHSQSVDVGVDDVELARAVLHAGELKEVSQDRIDLAIAADGPGRDRDELRAGHRVAARKERDVVSAGDQLFGQPGHDSLGPAVAARWHRLVER
jgi:hypothetical protein